MCSICSEENELARVTMNLIHCQTKSVRRLLQNQIAEQIHLKQFTKTEMDLFRSVNRFLSVQIKAVSKDLLKAHQSIDGEITADALLAVVWDETFWNDQLVETVLLDLIKAMKSAAVAELSRLGINLKQKSTATDWLLSQGESPPPKVLTEFPQWMQFAIKDELVAVFQQDYWLDINRVTRKAIRKILDFGIVEGVSIAKIAKEIVTKLGSSYTRARARAIARTESGNALNSGRNLAYEKVKQEVGDEVASTMKKTWLSVLGNTTRATHADLDGVTEDEEGLFSLGGVRVPWPSHYSLPPHERINCQCTIVTEFGHNMSDEDLTELENQLNE